MASLSSLFSGINWTAVVVATEVAFFTHATSFKVGTKTVSVADVPGAPNHLTFAQAEAAAVAVLEGQSGTITVGDIQFTVA